MANQIDELDSAQQSGLNSAMLNKRPLYALNSQTSENDTSKLQSIGVPISALQFQPADAKQSHQEDFPRQDVHCQSKLLNSERESLDVSARKSYRKDPTGVFKGRPVQSTIEKAQ